MLQALRITSTSLRHSASLLALTLAGAGCATTGSTFKSGIGDTYLSSAPWVAGSPLPVPRGPLLVLPVAFQANALEPMFFTANGHQGGPLQALLADLQSALDARALGVRTTPFVGKGLVAPDVMFGCIMDAAQLDCDENRQTGLLGGSSTQHRLAVGRPSAKWIAELQQRLDSTGASHALITTVEVGQYLPRQRGIKGTKYVELGRGNEVNLPWLTSLETPVPVLQLTAAIVDRNGRTLRIAAEGLLAKRTSMLMSAVDMQAVLQDKDLDALRTAVREDLAGTPRTLDTGLDNLLRNLQLFSTTAASR
ncbi:hypothetical protein [Gemmatimonas sp.]